ncbi:hypothetical protein G4X40_19555 [Rhodococcus sp. D2-41]|uniref:hypothetical protein n=1 Tax=Speluncibacter jeojiensis TaxID=2710754 RepID=UPI0024104716|nr:hypothetical protein [Rhodococcus sp. D2-41]MDG3012339.1 hypothetical protein [Rhodococcus sp. D2-41]
MTGRNVLRAVITAASVCAIGGALAPLAGAATTAPLPPKVQASFDMWSNATITVSNPNTEASACGVAVIKLPSGLQLLPTQVFPTGWSQATGNWAAFPNAAAAGQSATYSISHLANGNYSYVAACADASGQVSSTVTEQFSVVNAVPAPMLGSMEGVLGPIVGNAMKAN